MLSAYAEPENSGADCQTEVHHCVSCCMTHHIANTVPKSAPQIMSVPESNISVSEGPIISYGAIRKIERPPKYLS